MFLLVVRNFREEFIFGMDSLKVFVGVRRILFYCIGEGWWKDKD